MKFNFINKRILRNNITLQQKTMPKLVRGFTLIEMMVAVSVFSIIMTLSMGSILSILDANQKSRTLNSAMDNLNFTLEGMTRTIRFGTNYHCGSSGNTSLPLDCASPGTSLTLRDVNGVQVTYSLSGGRVARSINGGANQFLTSPDMTITTLAFRVYGSPAYSNGADLFQPQAIVVIEGNVGNKNSTKTTFGLQTTITQRIFDFQ